MLSGIANSFCSGEGYAGAAEVVKDIVSKPDVVLSDVSPKKISRIAIWGPRQVESRAQTVAKEAFEGNEMPVLVAYGGLHALKAVIQNSREGGQAMLVFPQKDDTTEETLGYKLIRSQGEVEVVSLIQSDLLTDKKLALIDDATHTGATLQNMRGVFPNATIQERPLFKT